MIKPCTFLGTTRGICPKGPCPNGAIRKQSSKSVPFTRPIAPFTATCEHLPMQEKFIPTTLTINPDFMSDDFIRDGNVPFQPSTFNPNRPAVLGPMHRNDEVPIMPGAVYIPPFREQSSHFWNQNVRFSAFVDESFNAETEF